MTVLLILLLTCALLATRSRTLVGQTVGMLGVAVLVGALAALNGNWIVASVIWAVWAGAILALAVIGTALRGGKAGEQSVDGVPEMPRKGKWISLLFLGLGLAVANKLPVGITDWSHLPWDTAQLFTTRAVWLEAISALLLAALIVALRMLGSDEEAGS